jgi:phage major head subunit gpT-like protein
MAIQGNLPKHLEVAARTGVLVAPERPAMGWRQVAMEIDLTAASTTLVDLGGIPYPTQNPQVVQSIIEKGLTVEPEDWYLTVSLSQNLIDDDQTGSVYSKFRSVQESFDRHVEERVFTVLNAGDGQTYGAAYDGQDFFDSDHKDIGAEYTTNQDNENALALSLDNFETVHNSAQLFRNDRGKFTNYMYDLLVVHPSLRRIAVQITGNANAYDTGNQETNPYSGMLKAPLTSPWLDSTAWYLIASSERVKPLFVAVRKRPTLIDIKFDGQQENGGLHYFTYHARNVIGYGDWRLAAQGNT